jgi:hypothetical protein
MTYKIVTDRELALERENANMLDTINKQSISIEKLRKVVEMKDLTIEALKADAERYQWWSAAISRADLDYLEKVFKSIPTNGPVKKQDLDAAIDNARKEQS